MSTSNGHLVQPEVFRNVDLYASQLGGGAIKADAPLKVTTPIIVFCQTFFSQFFEHVLGNEIKHIDEQSKEEAVAILADAPEARRLSVPVRQLVVQFEELCDRWQDALGMGYGTSRREFIDFHRVYFPRLLQSISEWTASIPDQVLTDFAKRAEDAYNAALAKFLAGI